MKNIKIAIIAILGLLMGYACEDDKENPSVNTANAKPATLLTPAGGNTYTLLLAEGESNFEKFTWTEADYGTTVPRMYSLQLCKGGNNFATSSELVNTGEVSYTTTNAAINLALYDLGVLGGAEGNVDIRVVSEVNSTKYDTALTSEPVTIKVTPYAYAKPNLTAPSNNSSFVMVKDETGTVEWETFTWNAVDYGADFGQKYTLQFDKADSNFVDPVTLTVTSATSWTGLVADVNKLFLKRGLVAGQSNAIDVVAISAIDDTKGIVASAVTRINVTPYEDQITVEIPKIYMLGGGTTAGWSNNASNIPAYYQPTSGADSTFTAVDKLTPAGVGGSDGFVKFVRFIGAWAPQWGTDATGTNASGPLVYRPTEDIADPAAIPGPATAGDYLVTANIVSLTYKIEKVTETLYLIGDATTAKWDNTKAVELTKTGPGKFSVVTTLSTTGNGVSEGFKFLTTLGAWEPMYGAVDKTKFDEGYLTYRPVGAPDVSSIAPPAKTGSYLIEVDLAKNMYKITPQ